MGCARIKAEEVGILVVAVFIVQPSGCVRDGLLVDVGAIKCYSKELFNCKAFRGVALFMVRIIGSLGWVGIA